MYFDPNQRLLQISIHYKFAEILFKVYVGFGFGSDIYKVWLSGGSRMRGHGSEDPSLALAEFSNLVNKS